MMKIVFVFLCNKRKCNKIKCQHLFLFLLVINITPLLPDRGLMTLFFFPSMNPLCCKYADLFSTMEDYIWRIVYYSSRDENTYFSFQYQIIIPNKKWYCFLDDWISISRPIKIVDIWVCLTIFLILSHCSFGVLYSVLNQLMNTNKVELKILVVT